MDECLPIIDSQMHLAIAINDHRPGLRYLFVDLDAGTVVGDLRFRAGEWLKPEPRGFSRLSTAYGSLVAYQHAENGGTNSSIVFAADAGTRFVSTPNQRGGYAVVRSDLTNDGGWVESLGIVSPEWTTAEPVPVQSGADGGTPGKLLIASDYGGNILLISGEKSPSWHASCVYLWLRPDGTVIGCGPDSQDFNDNAYGFIGAVGVETVTIYPPYPSLLLQDPDGPTRSRPRTYLSGWSIIRHGLAYGSWGEFCGDTRCSGDPDMVWIDAAATGECGRAYFTPLGAFDFAASRDGTLVQYAGCRMRVWPRVVP